MIDSATQTHLQYLPFLEETTVEYFVSRNHRNLSQCWIADSKKWASWRNEAAAPFLSHDYSRNESCQSTLKNAMGGTMAATSRRFGWLICTHTYCTQMAERRNPTKHLVVKHATGRETSEKLDSTSCASRQGSVSGTYIQWHSNEKTWNQPRIDIDKCWERALTRTMLPRLSAGSCVLLQPSVTYIYSNTVTVEYWWVALRYFSQGSSR